MVDQLQSDALESVFEDEEVKRAMDELRVGDYEPREAIEKAVEAEGDSLRRSVARASGQINELTGRLFVEEDLARRKYTLEALRTFGSSLAHEWEALQKDESEHRRLIDLADDAVKPRIVDLERQIGERHALLEPSRSQVDAMVKARMVADDTLRDLRASADVAGRTRDAELADTTLRFVKSWLDHQVEERVGHHLTGEPKGLGQARGDYYRPTEAHVALSRAIVGLEGGSIGISGPRGCGKSTLLEAVCAAKKEDGSAFSVTVSAPVNYEPREFLLHLFAKVCREAQGPTPQSSLIGQPPSATRLVGGGSALALAFGLIAAGTGLVVVAIGLARHPLNSDALLIASAALAVALGLAIRPRRSAPSRRALQLLEAGVALAALGALVYSALWYGADWAAPPWQVALGVVVWLGLVLATIRWAARRTTLRALLVRPGHLLLPPVLVSGGLGGIAVAVAWRFGGHDAAGGAAWAAEATWSAGVLLTGAVLWRASRRELRSVGFAVSAAATGVVLATAAGLAVAAAAGEPIATQVEAGALVAALAVITKVLSNRLSRAQASTSSDRTPSLLGGAIEGFVDLLTIAAVAVGIALVGFGWLRQTFSTDTVLGVVWLVLGTLVVVAALGLRRSMALQQEAYAERMATDQAAQPELAGPARDALELIEYQQTYTSGWSGALKFPASGKLPIGVEAAVSGGHSMAQQALTQPEIVRQFKSFLQLASGPDRTVFIGIDELDKMASDATARDFLNDIKALFEVPRCFYLISVSEDAVASFERRGLPFRDVFDSAFDEIVRVGYLDYAAAREVLRGRMLTLPAPFIGLCYCLSGGLPRDLIRFARWMFESGGNRDLTKTSELLAKRELTAKREATIAAIAGLDQSKHAGACQLWLSEERNGVLRTTDPDEAPCAADAGDALTRLVEEFLAYRYFLVTIKEFFSWELVDRRAIAEDPASGTKSLQQLASARQAFVVNPALARARTKSFRDAWELDPPPAPATVEQAASV